MNNSLKGIMSVLMVVVLLFSISLSVSAMSIYNVNGDTDIKGKEIIDIRDLVRAKKLSAQDPGTYNSVFLAKLVCILLGIDELPEQNSGGSIYLPEVP